MTANCLIKTDFSLAFRHTRSVKRSSALVEFNRPTITLKLVVFQFRRFLITNSKFGDETRLKRIIIVAKIHYLYNGIFKSKHL